MTKENKESHSQEESSGAKRRHGGKRKLRRVSGFKRCLVETDCLRRLRGYIVLVRQWESRKIIFF